VSQYFSTWNSEHGADHEQRRLRNMGCGCSLGRPGNGRLDAWTPVSAPSGHAPGAALKVQWIIIASSSPHHPYVGP